MVKYRQNVFFKAFDCSTREHAVVSVGVDACVGLDARMTKTCFETFHAYIAHITIYCRYHYITVWYYDIMDPNLPL